MRRQRQTGESSDAEGTNNNNNSTGFSFGSFGNSSFMNTGNGNGVGRDANINEGGNGSGAGETVGHATAAAAASTWDIEEDHLLSYFLCGNDASNNSLPPINDDAAREDDTPSTAAQVWPGAAASSTSHQSDPDLNQPATPAVQFYASAPSPARHASQQQQQRHAASLHHPFVQNSSAHNLNKVPSRTDTSSSSSSSLSSLAAALALGGGPAVMQVQQHLQARETHAPTTSPPPNHISPISPAHIISQHLPPNQQETMMLPPPPRFPNQSTTQHGNQNTNQNTTQSLSHPSLAQQQQQNLHWQHQQQHQQQQQQQQQAVQWQTPTHAAMAMPLHQQHTSPNHVEWIRQMNTMAMQQPINQTTMSVVQPHILPQTPQQPAMQPILPQQHQQQQHQIQKEEKTFQPFLDHKVQKIHSQPQAILPNNQTMVAAHAMSAAAAATDSPSVTASIPTQPVLSLAPTTPSTSNITQAQSSSITATPAGESEERRQRRLARNRESARLSRRRKKEHLANLGDRVERLHNQIEAERRLRLQTMETGLQQNRTAAIQQLCALQFSSQTSNAIQREENGMEIMTKLAEILRESSPNCPVRKAAIHFHYNTLKSTVLPHYYKYFLWMSTRQGSYFLAGKESRPRTTAKSSGRVSSKQIGEEITTAIRNSKAASSSETPTNPEGEPAPSSSTSSTGRRRKSSGSSSTSSPTTSGVISCRATQAEKLWPLFCYEHSVSVDQEERFLMAHKRSREKKNLQNDRAQIAIAANMISNLKTGVLYQCDMATHRSENCLFRVLTPAQVCRFLHWFAQNKERCHRVASKLVLDGRNDRGDAATISDVTSSSVDGSEQGQGSEVSFNDVCNRLEKALKIHSKDT